MANVIPFGVDAVTGQNRALAVADQLADTGGNLILDGSNRLLSSFTAVLSTPGATTLYIVPSGKTVFVTEVLVAIDASTDITTPASVSVGVDTNSDIVPVTNLVNLIAANRYYSLDVSALAQVATSSGQIVIDVTTAATGVGSPSQTATIYLLGIEI